MTNHRREDIMEISTRWMSYAHRHYLDTHTVWYLYNLACGWNINDREMEALKNWVKSLDHEKDDVKTVDIYIGRMLS
jgi:hypothetical protein